MFFKMTDQEIKYLKIGGGILVGGFILYFLLKGNPNNSGAIDDPTGNNNGGTIPVITFNAKAVADNLFSYMDKWGTDEDEIISELTNVNQFQFQQIVTAFGRRNYNSWTGADDYGGTLQPLKFWLNQELSTTDYNILKLKFPNSL